MPVLGSYNWFLMIGFQPEEIPIDCWIQVLEWGSVDSAKLLDWSCAMMGLALYCLLCCGFHFDIFLALGCSKLQKRCLGEKPQQVQVGLCSSSVLHSSLRSVQREFHPQGVKFSWSWSTFCTITWVWDHWWPKWTFIVTREHCLGSLVIQPCVMQAL